MTEVTKQSVNDNAGEFVYEIDRIEPWRPWNRLLPIDIL